MLLVVGLVLFGACGFESIESFGMLLSISQARAVDDRVQHSTTSPSGETVTLRRTPPFAEAQDLFLLSWTKADMVSKLDKQVAASVLANARRDAEQSVISAPGYSAGWVLLSSLGRMAGAPPGDIAKFLTTAILTAPFEPDRVITRIENGFAVYGALDADGRDLLASQIRIAWRHRPNDLVRTALVDDRISRLSIVRMALASDPSVLADFETLLGKR